MRKRMRPATNTGDQHDYDPEDYVSRMPDEILVSILSKFPIKEAAATSLLSNRWRYMWHRTLRLDFQDKKRMEEIALEPKLRLQARNKYINWVNRVMSNHSSPKIEIFKICFDLDKHSKGAITRWLEFAISKNVQYLEIDLKGEKSIFAGDTARNFVFPSKILDKKASVLWRRQSTNVPRVPSTNVMEIKFLKTLIMRCVNINDETLGKIIKSSPVLQILIIYYSGHLVNVKIKGPYPALTMLKIRYCYGIESIEICDSNICWFEYEGSEITLKLNNNPSLTAISIGDVFSGIGSNLLQQISSYIPYLTFLELNIHRPQENMHLLTFPELHGVRNLSMQVGAWDDDSLLGLTCLAKACSKLEALTIQLIWRTPVITQREIIHGMKHTYQHLEWVVIGGYYGRISDLELVLHFYENSVALKQIVVNPRSQTSTRNPASGEMLMKENAARSAAAKLQLVPRISNGVELVII